MEAKAEDLLSWSTVQDAIALLR